MHRPKPSSLRAKLDFRAPTFYSYQHRPAARSPNVRTRPLRRLALAHDRTLPWRTHHCRRGHRVPTQRILRCRHQRRSLEDRRFRAHLAPSLRRSTHRLSRRHRHCAIGPEHHLCRQRRRRPTAGSFGGRWHVQIHRRRKDLAPSGTARRSTDLSDSGGPARSQSSFRGRARSSLWPQRRARGLPIHRRRRKLAEVAL